MPILTLAQFSSKTVPLPPRLSKKKPSPPTRLQTPFNDEVTIRYRQGQGPESPGPKEQQQLPPQPTPLRSRHTLPEDERDDERDDECNDEEEDANIRRRDDNQSGTDDEEEDDGMYGDVDLVDLDNFRQLGLKGDGDNDEDMDDDDEDITGNSNSIFSFVSNACIRTQLSQAAPQPQHFCVNHPCCQAGPWYEVQQPSPSGCRGLWPADQEHSRRRISPLPIHHQRRKSVPQLR